MGKSIVGLNFDYDGGGGGKGSTAILLVNGEKVANARIERTQGMIFSADETDDIGLDRATPVTVDYKRGNKSFADKILRLLFDVKSIGVAEKAEEDKTQQKNAKVKKALSD